MNPTLDFLPTPSHPHHFNISIDSWKLTDTCIPGPSVPHSPVLKISAHRLRITASIQELIRGGRAYDPTIFKCYRYRFSNFCAAPEFMVEKSFASKGELYNQLWRR